MNRLSWSAAAVITIQSMPFGPMGPPGSDSGVVAVVIVIVGCVVGRCPLFSWPPISLEWSLVVVVSLVVM